VSAHNYMLMIKQLYVFENTW